MAGIEFLRFRPLIFYTGEQARLFPQIENGIRGDLAVETHIPAVFVEAGSWSFTLFFPF